MARRPSSALMDERWRMVSSASQARRGPGAPGIAVTVRHELAATVVSVEGVAGGEVSDAVLGRGLPLPVGGASAVVVDLDGLTLLDRDVVCRLLTSLQAVLASSGARMMVVRRRSTARSLLRAWHLHERMAIYPTLDAALG